jgi:hypothetical protein
MSDDERKQRLVERVVYHRHEASVQHCYQTVSSAGSGSHFGSNFFADFEETYKVGTVKGDDDRRSLSWGLNLEGEYRIKVIVINSL